MADPSGPLLFIDRLLKLLAALLHSSACRLPGKAALIRENESVTYGGLDAAVTQLAAWLLEQGLAPGDRVAVHSLNLNEAAKLFLA